MLQNVLIVHQVMYAQDISVLNNHVLKANIVGVVFINFLILMEYAQLVLVVQNYVSKANTARLVAYTLNIALLVSIKTRSDKEFVRYAQLVSIVS
jgi:hypothetical protein